GNNDTVQWGSGNNSLVSMGDGSYDYANFQTGSGNTITMGDGQQDEAQFQTGSENCITLGDGNDDFISVTSGDNNTLTVGDGNFDLVSVANADVAGNNLLQCGDGNYDVLAMGAAAYGPLFGTTPTNPATPLSNPPIIGITVPGTSSNDVLEAGNGSGDFLMGANPEFNPATYASLGGDTMIAGTGVGDATFDTSAGTWSGTWGDTLTGNAGTFLSGSFDADNNYTAATSFTGGDTYVLSCGGGDLVQDSSGELDGALIVNLGGTSQAVSGFASNSGGSNGGWGGGCDDSGGSCGGGGGYSGGGECGGGSNWGGGGDCGGTSGSGSQGSTFTALNAIDVTDMSGSDATTTPPAMSSDAPPPAGANQVDFGYDQLTCVFQSSTDTSLVSVADYATDQSVSFSLFGQYVASGFSLGTDTGIVNDEASYMNNEFGFSPFSPATAGSGQTQDNGLLITYTSPAGSTAGGGSCGTGSGGGCGGDDNCGGSSNPCGGGSYSGGSCGGGSSSSGSCGGGSYGGGECGGSNIGSCGGSDSNCLASSGCA
ncbi:MAG TPA: hypothetical protein VMB84_14120, partial [Stellaceae bacterium]|nr:hypothetical protein [Stellaceae bacterium]